MQLSRDRLGSEPSGHVEHEVAPAVSLTVPATEQDRHGAADLLKPLYLPGTQASQEPSTDGVCPGSHSTSADWHASPPKPSTHLHRDWRFSVIQLPFPEQNAEPVQPPHCVAHHLLLKQNWPSPQSMLLLQAAPTPDWYGGAQNLVAMAFNNFPASDDG